MSEMIFIADMNLFVNLDEVISAEYEPEHYCDIDDYTPKGEVPRQRFYKARMSITTTALEVGTIEGYEGSIRAAGSESKVITLFGPIATRMHERLVNFSELIQVETDPENNGNIPF